MEERKAALGATCTGQLCKAMLMQNRSHSGRDVPENSEFYLVVVQYVAAINVKKMEAAVRTLLPPQERRGASDFSFCVAKDSDSLEITGFAHNSVSPFGLARKVPIILSKAVADEHRFMWMGGGHVDLKVGMSVEDFVRATSCFVLDASNRK